MTDETFCIYCQHEYASPGNLNRHVLRKHPGTYRANAICQWFARCEREAVTTVAHPILGEVPCCQRCADFATKPLH